MPSLQAAQVSKQEVSDEELVQIVSSISAEISDGLPKLSAALQLSDFLRGLQNQVYPGPNGIVQDAVSQLLEFADVVHAAGHDPDTLPEPSTLKMVGLATIRARFGVKFVTRSCSGVVAGKLATLGEECLSLGDFALQISEYLKLISAKLVMCTTPVCQTIEGLLSLQRQMSSLASGGARQIKTYSLGFLKNLLDLGPFRIAVQSLLELPDSLEPIIAQVRERVEMVHMFAANARDDVEASFKLPFPASMMQNAILGNEPPVKQSLLHQLESLQHELALRDIVEMLDMLSESLSALNVDIPISQVEDFVDHATVQLNRLDGVTSRQRRSHQV